MKKVHPHEFHGIFFHYYYTGAEITSFNNIKSRSMLNGFKSSTVIQMPFHCWSKTFFKDPHLLWIYFLNRFEKLFIYIVNMLEKMQTKFKFAYKLKKKEERHLHTTQHAKGIRKIFKLIKYIVAIQHRNINLKNFRNLFKNVCFIVILRVTYIVFCYFILTQLEITFMLPNIVFFLWFYTTIFCFLNEIVKLWDLNLRTLNYNFWLLYNNKNFQTNCKQTTKGQNWILM